MPPFSESDICNAIHSQPLHQALACHAQPMKASIEMKMHPRGQAASRPRTACLALCTLTSKWFLSSHQHPCEGVGRPPSSIPWCCGRLMKWCSRLSSLTSCNIERCQSVILPHLTRDVVPRFTIHVVHAKSKLKIQH